MHTSSSSTFRVGMAIMIICLSSATLLSNYRWSSSFTCTNLQEEQSIHSTRDPPTLSLSVDRDWCPHAKCYSSPMCRPCQRRFLIIVANEGRSASTTLTSMMNLLPGVRMSGECNNAIQHLRTMIKRITGPPFKQDDGPWYRNPIPEGSLACVSQKMIESITPPLFVNGTLLSESEEANEIVGFKTIRLFRNQTVSDVPKIAKFLQAHFPCSRYLFNFRSDVEAQAASQISNFKKSANKPIQRVIKDISRSNDLMTALAKQLGNQSMLLDSSRWIEDVSYLNEVVMWLGFDPKCAFPRLLEFNTGRTIGAGGAFTHTFTELTLDSRCRYRGAGGGTYRD